MGRCEPGNVRYMCLYYLFHIKLIFYKQFYGTVYLIKFSNTRLRESSKNQESGSGVILIFVLSR